MDRPLVDSPDLATPRDDIDDTLVRAIDAGHLEPSQAADPQLAAAFAAHQKLASLFALLRSDGVNAGGMANDPPPERLGRYVIVAQPPSAGQTLSTAEGGRATVLGAGAFGTVYLARDPELNRDVAIKVSSRSHRESARMRAVADNDSLSLRGRAGVGADNDSLSLRGRAGVGADNDSLSLRGRVGVGADAEPLDPMNDRMATEARHAASLNHPHIVSIYDVGREGDRLYIVMQFIAGRTLADLARDGPLSASRAAELLAAVADALHFAHKRGFVHRDLKPANILLDEQGVPHVADFGLAVSEETQRTLAGQVAGTPEYELLHWHGQHRRAKNGNADSSGPVPQANLRGPHGR